MAGFEPQISGIRSNRSTNCATTTVLLLQFYPIRKSHPRLVFANVLIHE